MGPTCSRGYADNPADGGLDAPILEIADHGDYQQVTVQVPWEYVKYPQLATGEVCKGASQVSVSQSDLVATSAINGNAESSNLFLDSEGYVRAQHSSDLSWVTASNPAHPNELIILHAANLGAVVNPPPTGHVTPLPFSTVISKSGKTNGPIPVDTTHTSLFFNLIDESGNVMAGLLALSATLTPGAVSRYQVPIRMPSTLQSSVKYFLSYDWRYCPFGPVVVRCRGGQSAGSISYRWPIHVAVP